MATLMLLALGFYLLPVQRPAAPFSTVLLARDGELLGATLAADQQWRFPLAEQPPARFLQALIRFEDQRFYRHWGVDPLALARAMRQNWQAGAVRSGASTLSMQVVRMARGNPPRTVPEKLLEMILALRLEAAHDKREILHFYAQFAPFGGNVVGVESAAQRYFGRGAGELSWAEAATLAVLPNAPALVHPGRERETLRVKRDRLLDRMLAAGDLSALDHRLAKLEPVPDRVLALPSSAPHLLQTLAGQHGGKRLSTSIEPELQQSLNEVMTLQAQRLALEGVLNAAVLVIDNRQREVTAYIGNSALDRGHSLRENIEQEKAERGEAMDLIHRGRSSGSILKPLLYALMLEAGEITPSMLVADVPTQINGYRPDNFDRQFRGAVRADQALALSLNIPAVRLLRAHGLQRFYQELQSLGFSSLFRPAEQYGLTLILGGAETTLWDVAQSYAHLAAISQQFGATTHYQPIRILNDEASEKGSRADFGPGAAYLTLTAMAEVNRPGLDQHWRSFSSSRPVAWKTGTSFGLRDAWAVAVTPRHTVAVWAGNASGEGVAGLSGTNTAAPLLFAVLNRLPDSGWFTAPAEDLRSVELCRDSGYLPSAGCPTETMELPKHSQFDQVSRWHRQITVDHSGRSRLHAGCALLSEMRPETLLQLPPGMAFYYRKQHPDYRDLPSWKAGCHPDQDELAMELLYPEPGAQFFLPTDINGQQMPMIAEVAHRQPTLSLYWHLDEQFLGQTREFHTMSFHAAPGRHVLSIVDQHGVRISREFTVLAK